ncbi:MAG: DUF3298 domain-containing protein [Nitrospirota bacterium]
MLVEAGHRCSIPHCNSTEIDVHHIVPWEICHEHSPENLIALCPNCHRRAHKEEIDRKALILYKLRGQRIFRGEPTQAIESTDPWSTRIFRETRNDSLKYDAQAEYPYFSPSEYSWAEEANAYIQAAVISDVQGIRNLANEAPWTWPLSEEDEGESSFGASYDNVFFRGRLLSIRFSFFAYHFGGNHPNHWTRTLNLFLDPIYNIELKHFFGAGVDYLGLLSIVVRQKLLSRCGLNVGNLDRLSVLKGTDPELRNFSTFNVSASGLLFNFDEYSVGPYAAGRQEVWVPFSEMSGLVLPDELKR